VTANGRPRQIVVPKPDSVPLPTIHPGHAVVLFHDDRHGVALVDRVHPAGTTVPTMDGSGTVEWSGKWPMLDLIWVVPNPAFDPQIPEFAHRPTMPGAGIRVPNPAYQQPGLRFTFTKVGHQLDIADRIALAGQHPGALLKVTRYLYVYNFEAR
jgi:hypothetical protein